MKVTFKNPEPVRPNCIIEIEQDRLELIMRYMFYSSAGAVARGKENGGSATSAAASKFYLELMEAGLSPRQD